MGARRPPLILLENVTGFLTSNDGADFPVDAKKKSNPLTTSFCGSRNPTSSFLFW
jgi:hypothetical protein